MLNKANNYVHRILLGLNKVNPLLIFTSEEASNFKVCRNHQHLCMDPKKFIGGKVTCTGCKTRTSDRIANLRTSLTLSVTSESRVLLGDFICAVCAKVRVEDDIAITAFLQNEHATTGTGHEKDDQSLMDVSAQEAGGTGGTKASVGGGGGGGQDMESDEIFYDSQPMSTEEEDFPGLSQGSRVCVV